MILWLSIIVLAPVLLVLFVLKLQQHFEWEWLEAWLVKLDRFSNKRHGFRLPLVEIIFIPVILILVYMAFKYERNTVVPFNNRIAVLADSTEWAVLEPVFRQTFERVVRTPQPEHLFHLVRPHDLEARKARIYRYWVLATTLESEGPVHDIVMNEVLPANSRDLLERDGHNAFLSGGPWGFDQLVLTILGHNTEEVAQFIETESDSLFAVIEDDAHLSLRYDLYVPADAVRKAQTFADSAGWAFEQQANMILRLADYENGFAAFSSTIEGRWISVRWIENADSAWVNPEWIISERNRLSRVYEDSTYVVDKYLNMKNGHFLGRRAMLTRGLWADDHPSCGGPFTNYTFYNPEDKRLYMIDVSVYAAGKDKLPYLQPLEVIAHTFVTQRELKQRRLDK